MGINKRLLVLTFFIIFVLGSIVLGVFMGCQLKDPDRQLKAAQPQINDDSYHIDEKRIKEHIRKLASKDFEGRRAGSRGDAEASLYLAQELKEYGLEPLGDKGTFFQSFPIPGADLRWDNKRLVFYLKDNGNTLLSDNVLGVIKSSKRPEEYVLLSAHFDHLGQWQNRLYPGANDNASGVGAVLEMARVLSSQKKDLPYSIIVAFWGAEEMGLIGSKYFIDNPPLDLKKIYLAINLDSIGSGNENHFLYWSAGPRQVTDELYSRWQNREQLVISRQDTTHNTSDHEALGRASIPAVTILSDNWLVNNHTHLDVPDRINSKKTAFLARQIIDFITSPEITELLAKE